MSPDLDPTSPAPAPDAGTPENIARKAVAAVLELHVATTGPLEPASLPTVTREVQTLTVLLGDVAQDLKLFSQRYSLDSGGIGTDQNLRTQARVAGASATRKFVEAVELLYRASGALAQAQDDTSLMADLSPSSPQATPPTTNPGRTPDPRPTRSATADHPDDGPSL